MLSEVPTAHINIKYALFSGVFLQKCINRKIGTLA